MKPRENGRSSPHKHNMIQLMAQISQQPSTVAWNHSFKNGINFFLSKPSVVLYVCLLEFHFILCLSEKTVESASEQLKQMEASVNVLSAKQVSQMEELARYLLISLIFKLDTCYIYFDLSKLIPLGPYIM
jgi:hypothetical protein